MPQSIFHYPFNYSIHSKLETRCWCQPTAMTIQEYAIADGMAAISNRYVENKKWFHCHFLVSHKNDTGTFQSYLFV